MKFGTKRTMCAHQVLLKDILDNKTQCSKDINNTTLKNFLTFYLILYMKILIEYRRSHR